jgi:hypothetical protein
MKKTGYRFVIILLALVTALSAGAQSKRHPVGAIRVTTQTRGSLYVDEDLAKKMTVYHQVTVSGLSTGPHSLSFLGDSSQVQLEITVRQGQTEHYIIHPDTVILDSTEYGKTLTAKGKSVHSYYIPKASGLYMLANLGFGAGNGCNAINGRVVAGYQFSPKFSLGGGIAYVKNFAKFSHISYEGTYEGFDRTRSSVFSVSYIPVFLDIRLNANQKRIVPYLAMDIGCSLALTQNIDGHWGGSGNNYDIFHIRKVNPGFYLGLNPGVKCYLYSKYYLDLSMGVDLCVNSFGGDLPFGHTNKTKSTSNFHMTVGFGF